MICNLAVIKGDGIGPEVVTEAMKVLDKVGEKFGHTFNYEQILMGGCSIDATGEPLTDEAVAIAKSKDAVLQESMHLSQSRLQESAVLLLIHLQEFSTEIQST